MILLCRNGTKRFPQLCKQVYDFFLSFIFRFKHLFYLFYWIQLCLLISAHRHQIPLRTALSELIGSDFLFILTVGELHCRLNSSSSWMELRSRKGSRPRWCLLFISRWELFSFSQFSQHISLLGLQLQGAHMKRRRVIQMILCLSLVFLRVYIFFIFFFSSVKKWKAFQGLICPIVHLLLTKAYSLLLAQHLPWILAIIFPLEDAFVM